MTPKQIEKWARSVFLHPEREADKVEEFIQELTEEPKTTELLTAWRQTEPAKVWRIMKELL